MKSDKELQEIKDCGWEIITAMRTGIPSDKLFMKMTKKYKKEILLPALRMVEKFQIHQAKEQGIDLSELNLPSITDDALPDVYEPEAQFFGGSITHEKKKQFGDRYGK